MSEPVHLDIAHLRQTKPQEYVIRFLFGGAVTAIAGFIAHLYGPVIGGLFLAFPAILPASVTLIDQHDGAGPAGVDALGAALGSIGLVAFAIVVWLLLTSVPGLITLLIAVVMWFVVSVIAWYAFCRLRELRRAG